MAEELLRGGELLQTQEAEVFAGGGLQEESAGEGEVDFLQLLGSQRQEEALAAVAAQQREGGGDGSEVQGQFLGGLVLVVGGC